MVSCYHFYYPLAETYIQQSSPPYVSQVQQLTPSHAFALPYITAYIYRLPFLAQMVSALLLLLLMHHPQIHLTHLICFPLLIHNWTYCIISNLSLFKKHIEVIIAKLFTIIVFFMLFWHSFGLSRARSCCILVESILLALFEVWLFCSRDPESLPKGDPWRETLDSLPKEM